MNPLKIYDTHFHSMGIHVVKYSDKVELSQTLTIVADNKAPEWTLSSLFGRQKGISACPLADESRVVINNVSDAASLSPQPTSFDDISHVAVYNLLENKKIQDIRVVKPSKGLSMYSIVVH
jgi:hypothetical protein